MFLETVHLFLHQKAKSLGSSIEYVVPSLITSTAFLLAINNATFQVGTPHLQPLNFYTMTISHPGTEKSPAIESVLGALREMETILNET